MFRYLIDFAYTFPWPIRNKFIQFIQVALLVAMISLAETAPATRDKRFLFGLFDDDLEDLAAEAVEKKKSGIPPAVLVGVVENPVPMPAIEQPAPSSYMPPYPAYPAPPPAYAPSPYMPPPPAYPPPAYPPPYQMHWLNWTDSMWGTERLENSEKIELAWSNGIQ